MRLSTERKTVHALIKIFCRAHHAPDAALCPECQELEHYADERLSKCPFAENKPVCSRCRVHCYNKSMREQIRFVMRYSGPRLLFRHPLLAFKHIWHRILSGDQVKKKTR